MTASNDQSVNLIRGLTESAGTKDPVEAMRLRATQAIDSYVATFGEPERMPLNLWELASFLGIAKADTRPVHSPDAELAPVGDGRVEIRINPDRPETRQRFSLGHEISHTFFPDHSSHVWPRADSRYRSLVNATDFVESLCDIGAAELVFPRRWFSRDAAAVTNARELLALAARYDASREATVRRYAELHADAVCAVFLSWKLKPTQRGTVGNPDQANLFGISANDERREALRLRVEYTIPSPSFSTPTYVPRDKSVENSGPLYIAASTREPVDGECIINFGRNQDAYYVHALPVWTQDDTRGPNGEFGVAAIFRTLDARHRRGAATTPGRNLFD